MREESGEEPCLVHDIHGNLRWTADKPLIRAVLVRILRAVKPRVDPSRRGSVRMNLTRFDRRDAVRILHLDARALAAWERAGLIAAKEEYSFDELGELRTLRELRARRISARSIRAALQAMQRGGAARNVLREVSAAAGGARLRFRHEGSLVDPITQQLVFDFEMPGTPNSRLQVVGTAEAADGRRKAQVQEMFLEAVRLEEDKATVADAMAVYQEILELRPHHAPSLINLGTIHYNQRAFAEAEGLYRRATEADPRYALAYFDLGNVLDELHRLPEATAAYQRAIELVPHYADAHYNLALSYERQGQRRRALRHWLSYVRLDPVGPWSTHARGQAKRTLKLEKLSIVSRRGRLVQAG